MNFMQTFIKRIMSILIVLLLCVSNASNVFAATNSVPEDTKSEYETALQGLLAGPSLKFNTNTIVNSAEFQHGIYITKDSQENVLNLINFISTKTYVVNESHYLQCVTNDSINKTKSETVSKKIDALISGEATYVIGINDGWWKNTADGEYEKQLIKQEKSSRFQKGENTLIIFNNSFFNDVNSLVAVDFMTRVLKDETLGATINKELVKQDETISPVPQPVTRATTGSSISTETGISPSSATDDFMSLLEKSRKRLEANIKNNKEHPQESSDAVISPNGIIIGATKVYGGPGSIAYAEIGSLSTGDFYDVICDEFGWEYVSYQTASGTKTGYILGGDAFAYPPEYNAGVSGKMNYMQYVYAGPSNTDYVNLGSVSIDESVVVLVTDIVEGYDYIEYSSSIGTKRGFVAAWAVTLNGNTALAKMSSNSSTFSGPNTYYSTVGVLNLEEYVIILEKNITFAYVEYNTKYGRKKAYIPLSNLQILNTSSTIPGISITTNYKDATMNADSSVYGGPSLENYSTIGSVSLNESIGVINVENGWLYIQYYTSSGPKRGYVLITQVNNGANIAATVTDKTKTYNGENNAANINATIYSGPSTGYATVGSVSQYEGFTKFTTQENSFYFIEYSTSTGTKRGFIKSSDLASRPQGGLAVVTAATLNAYYGSDFTDSKNLRMGAVWIDEYVTVLEKNGTASYVEYNTLAGRKRGYVLNSGLYYKNIDSVPALPNYTESTYVSLQSTNVYSGPDDNYAPIGSISNNENVIMFNTDVFGYSYIRFSTATGYKRGYVLKNLLKVFVYDVAIPDISLPYVTKGSYGTSGENRDLTYYTIGSGKNHMILNFAIHGWEDHWNQDGFELVLVAQQVLNKLSENISLVNNGDWTVYVIPTSNPDGLLNGTTSNGPGRCTTRMLDGSVQGIDMNRSFDSVNPIFEPHTQLATEADRRNYTGPYALMSRESVALRDFINAHKSSDGKNIFVDTHGWTGQILTNDPQGIVDNNFHHQFLDNLNGGLGSGYVATWAHDIGFESSLFEFPGDVYSHNDMIVKLYQQKYAAAIMDIITNTTH